MQFTVGVLNCRKNSEALGEALNYLSNMEYVLILNEANFQSEQSLSPDLVIFESLHSTNLHIVTNMNGWNLIYSTEEADILAIRSSRLKESFVVFGCYFNPKLSVFSVKERMDLIHERMYQLRSHRLIFGGDVNARSPLWSDNFSCNKGKIIMNSLVHNGLMSAVPVDLSTSKASSVSESLHWIDVLCVSKKLLDLIRKAEGVHITNSDHPMLVCVISKEDRVRTIISRKLLSKACEDIDLSFLDTPSLTADSFHNRWELLCERLQSLSIRAMRTFSSSRVSRNAPWHLVNERRKIFQSNKRVRRRLFRTDSPELRAKFVSLNTKIKFLDRQLAKSRIKGNKQRLENLLVKHGQWSVIKKFMGHQFFRKTGQVDEIKANPVKLANVLEFQKLYTLSSPCISDSVLREPVNMNIDLEKLLKFIIRKLAKKRCYFHAHLSCSILVELLKCKGITILRFIVDSISRAFIPAFMKQSRISLIPKSDSYKVRPISILHPLYRLTDCIMFYWIQPKLKLNLKFQYAFQRHKNIFYLLSSLKRDIDSLPEELLSILISLDLSDAFECVNFAMIRAGLLDAGLEVMETHLIIELISNRSSFIVVGDDMKWKIHSTGTPQGGFLSPLLFVIATFCIRPLINDMFKIYMFADDLVILSSGQSLETDIWQLTEKKLEILGKMLNLANLKVNPAKSKAMVVMKGVLKSNNLGLYQLVKSRQLFFNSQPINIVDTMSLLGIHLRVNNVRRWNHNIVLFCDNTLSTVLLRLENHLIRYGPRIQRLPLRLVHTMLTSIIGGCVQFYGPLQRIFSNFTRFESQMQICEKIIGRTIVSCLDLKRRTSHSFTYYLFFKKPLVFIIEKTVVQSNYRITNPNASNTLPIETKIPSIYGLFTVVEPRPHWYSEHEALNTRWSDTGEPNIKYKKALFENEIWFEISIILNESQVLISHHRYWSPTQAYLDSLEDALFQAMQAAANEFACLEEIFIESDKLMARRISHPLNRSRLNTFLEELSIPIIFLNRTPQTFHIHRQLWKTVPLLVAFPSTNYFQLLENSIHLKLSKQPGKNLAESALHRYKFRSIKWDVITRTNIFGLTLLAGGWRTSTQDRMLCPICNLEFSTTTVFTSPCSHLPPFPVDGVIVDYNYLCHSFSSLSRIKIISVHLYSCLKFCGVY